MITITVIIISSPLAGREAESVFVCTCNISTRVTRSQITLSLIIISSCVYARTYVCTDFDAFAEGICRSNHARSKTRNVLLLFARPFFKHFFFFFLTLPSARVYLSNTYIIHSVIIIISTTATRTTTTTTAQQNPLKYHPFHPASRVRMDHVR